MAAAKSPAVRECKSSRDLIDRIRRDVRDGYGFVPFVGSGVSAPSGIPMGQEFDEFLAYTVYRVLATEEERPKSRGDEALPRWCVRRDGWPKYPNSKDAEDTRKWVLERYREICRDLKIEVKSEGGFVTDLQVMSDALSGLAGDIALRARRPLVPNVIASADCRARDQELRSFLRAVGRDGPDRMFAGRHGYSPTSQDHIREAGIRSLSDWRATLHFLSRVKVDEDTGDLVLSESEPWVIDGFNIHITRGKRSNLTHKMLAHLATPMRIRTVVTTNFDTLLEDSFAQIQSRVAVFEVGSRGELPDPGTVRAQNCIVKLHGGMLDTRADFSLDDAPSDRDKASFAEYVRQRSQASSSRSAQSGRTRGIPNHLIVMGYSGSDQRCVQMIKYLLDQDPGVRIYWLAFNDADVRRVSETFYEDCYRKGGEPRVITYRSDRQDLLLYELYQELTLSLPAGGFAYQFTHKIPPERRLEFAASDAKMNKVGDAIVEILTNSQTRDARLAELEERADVHIERVPRDRDDDTTLSLEADGRSDLASAMRHAFRKLRSKHHRQCIWLELQDYASPHYVYTELLKVISVRLGLFQLEHVVLAPDESDRTRVGYGKHLKKAIEYFGIQPEAWVVFLYGRSCPGGCSGWDNRPWGRDEYDRFKELREALGAAGIRVVYMPLRDHRRVRNEAKLLFVDRLGPIVKAQATLPSKDEFPVDRYKSEEERRREEKEWRAEQVGFLDTQRILDSNSQEDTVLQGNPFLIPKHSVDATVSKWKNVPRGGPTTYESIVHRIVDEWLTVRSAGSEYDERLKKIQFLYAVTLFRQSRHTSAFFSEALFPCPHRFNADGEDNDWVRFDKVRKWIRDLEREAVFYHKPGGYAWKYRDMRLGIQRLIEGMENVCLNEPAESREKSRFVRFMGQRRARTHLWIGHWYLKAFYATGHAIPIIESLYHRLQCVRYSPYAKPPVLAPTSSNREELYRYRLQLFRLAILAMVKTSRMARPWLKFWLNDPGESSLFGEQAKAGRRIVEAAREKLEEMAKAEPALVAEGRTLKGLTELLRDEFDTLGGSLRAEAGKRGGKKFLLDIPPREPGEPERPETTTDLRFDAEILCSPDWRGRFRERLKAFKLEPTDPGLENVVEIIEQHEGAIRRAPNTGEESAARRRGISETLDERLVAIKSKWILACGGRQSYVSQAVQTISEFAYLHVKQAKLLDHSAGSNDADPEARAQIRALWVEVTALCNTAMDLLNHLHPAYLNVEIEEHIKCQTMYGLALGHLGRFFEAHRRLNEAGAVLSKMANTLESEEFAVIKLRRAEVFLCEAVAVREALNGVETSESEAELESLQASAHPQFANPVGKAVAATRKVVKARKRLEEIEKERFQRSDAESAIERQEQRIVAGKEERRRAIETLERIHYAKLDDAWVALEAAEQLLSGRSHSSLWWGRLFALKLRVYGEHQDRRLVARYESLAFRQRIQHDHVVHQLFDKGVLVSPSDPYRRLRLLDYYLKAVEKVTGSWKPGRLERAIELWGSIATSIRREPVLRAPRSPIRNYLGRMRKAIQAWKQSDETG